MIFHVQWNHSSVLQPITHYSAELTDAMHIKCFDKSHNILASQKSDQAWTRHWRFGLQIRVQLPYTNKVTILDMKNHIWRNIFAILNAETKQN